MIVCKYINRKRLYALAFIDAYMCQEIRLSILRLLIIVNLTLLDIPIEQKLIFKIYQYIVWMKSDILFRPRLVSYNSYCTAFITYDMLLQFVWGQRTIKR